MISHPILLMGGTGAIGRLTARALRSVYPDVPLLIGGRDLLKSRSAAGEIGRAEGVLIDTHADDLGLGDRQISAVAIFTLTNDWLACASLKAAGYHIWGFLQASMKLLPKLRPICTRQTPRQSSLAMNGWSAPQPLLPSHAPNHLPDFTKSGSVPLSMSRMVAVQPSPRILSG